MTRILIVAGEPESAVSLRAVLKAHGHTTEFSGDADAALRLAIRHHPDGLVLSGQLPGGTLATLKRVRASIHTAGVPVIVVGPAETRVAGDFIAAGAQEYLAEPVQAEALARAVRDNLGSLVPPLEAPAAVLAHPDRLAVLEGIAAPGTETSGVFDAITRLAKRLLEVPTALLSLVGADRQTFKSQAGLAEPWASAGQTPLSLSFCQWVVTGNEPMVVNDARKHPVLQANRAVRELGVVAYAGIPLDSGSDHTVGSFCALDVHPRSWSQKDLGTLADLARIVNLYLLLDRAPHAPMPDSVVVLDATAAAIPSAARVLMRWSLKLETEEADLLMRIIDEQTERLKDVALAARHSELLGRQASNL
jgi:GAF domain-containing protein